MKRIQSPAHLDFVRSLPCLICGNETSVEAAHVRFPDPRAAKRQTGMGEKSDDVWALPLCGTHHREQHSGSERMFWRAHGIDPIFVALALSRISGDREAAASIILFAKRELA
jgi:hypothetical protein